MGDMWEWRVCQSGKEGRERKDREEGIQENEKDLRVVESHKADVLSVG